MKQVTEERIEKYLMITRTALERIRVGEAKALDWDQKASEFRDMAQRYLSDAEHYRKKGDLVTAFAAVNYAHGWIDAGARIGLFVAGPDDDRYVMPP
jgi:uncharacterized protein